MILGLETSCDETAAALITHDGRILSNVVSSQADLHARYGGVVPEVASRRHLELVTPVLREALGEAGADRVAKLTDPARVAEETLAVYERARERRSRGVRAGRR